NVGCQPRTVLDSEELAHKDGKPPCMRFIMRLGLNLTRRDPRRVLLGSYDLTKLLQTCRPFNRSECQPVLDDLGVSNARLGAPSAVGVRHGAKKVAVETVIAALVGDIFLG